MSTHPTPEMVNREPIETPVIVAGLEVLAPTRIEFKAPTPAAYQTFEMILRCDAAEAPTERLIDPSLARDVLLEKLQAATEVRQRYNAFDRNRPVSDDELLQAYSDGADAYAGLMTLASDEAKPDEEAFEAFKSWSLLAVTALNQAEIRNGNKLHNRVYLTPAALANDPEFSNEIRETLPRLAQSQRVKQYWAAAQNNDAKAASEAFVGTDATRLNRAKALLYYAHYLPQEDTSLKVACLEESVAEIHTAVTTSERPSEDDLVGIYEYFMLESLLGIAVHDIVWLEDQDTKDGRARRLSVQYLTNASDALSYVRHHLTIDQSDIERAIQQNRADFNQAIEEDEVLLAARSTSDFLHAGKSQLETAKAALLNIQNDPYDYPEKQSRIDAAQQYVATLTAKAKDEQLDEKITKQNEVYAQRLEELTIPQKKVIDDLRSMMPPIIGDILPGTKGNRLAHLIVDIDKQLNDATYFASLYAAENRERAKHEYTVEQLGRSVVRLFEMIEDISPDDETMNALSFRRALASSAA